MQDKDFLKKIRAGFGSVLLFLFLLLFKKKLTQLIGA